MSQFAARYHRAAFVEEFERRLKAKPGKLDQKIVKAMDEAGRHVLAVLFDVDSGQEVERQGADNVYELRICLLYDSVDDEPTAYEAARKAADEIEKAFEAALQRGPRIFDALCETPRDSPADWRCEQVCLVP